MCYFTANIEMHDTKQKLRLFELKIWELGNETKICDLYVSTKKTMESGNKQQV
jgi:hypothetical protein